MGETAADTAREIAALRDETDRLLAEVEGRARRALEVPQQAARNPLVVAGAGIAAVLVVLALWYRSYRRAQEARRLSVRVKRGVEALGARAGRLREALAEEAPRPAPPARDEGGDLVQKIVGAFAASATLALVDQFVRWLSARRTAQTVDEAPPPPSPSPPPLPPAQEAAVPLPSAQDRAPVS